MRTLTWYIMPAIVILAYVPLLRNLVVRKRNEPAGEARWTLACCVGLNGVLLPFMLVEYSLKQQAPDLAISVAGGALVLARHGVFEWAKRILGENYTVELHYDTSALICSGPYAVVRHPIYLGRLMGTTGTTLILNTFVALCIFGTLDLVAVLLRIRAEEQLLIKSFGPEYERYRRRVGALTPFRTLKTLAAELCSRKKKEVGDVHK